MLALAATPKSLEDHAMPAANAPDVTLNQTVDQIAAAIAGASAAFWKPKIDFCRGGDVPLD